MNIKSGFKLKRCDAIIQKVLALIYLMFIGFFVSCGSYSPEQRDPIKDFAGCYRVKIRHFDGLSTKGRWEVKNICYNSVGNWIESNGLCIKIGRTNPDFGIFTVDTIVVESNEDTTLSRYKYLGFLSFKIDTINTGLGFEYGSDKFLIYDTYPLSLSCWEYIMPDSLFVKFRELNIQEPAMCQKTIDQIIDSSSPYDKTYDLHHRYQH